MNSKNTWYRSGFFTGLTFFIQRALLVLMVLLGSAFVLGGCVTIMGRPDTPTIDSSRYDDAGIKTGITSHLLKKSASKANDVNVHCYNGHVFLVGEADPEFRAAALAIAEEAEGVVHVTTHWFASGTAATALDAGIEKEIAAGNVFGDGIDTRRVAVDVWGGNVVLTGIVRKQRHIDRAVEKIKAIDKVRSVTSYLVLQ